MMIMRRFIISLVLLLLFPFFIKAQYPSSSGNNTGYEYISNVTINTINNNSTGSDADGDGDDGYDDYTSLTTSLKPGNSYTLSVTISPDANDYINAWIDWNGDGDFTDSGEEYTLASNTSNSGPFSVTVTVPASAVDISTRLRVSLKWNGAPASDENFSYGEVEDYTISTYTDTDNDNIPDYSDIDDDGDGITDAAEAGVNCTTTEVYYGANNGHMYKYDFNSKTDKLMTTSPYTSGYINALASNPDAGVVYYGVGTTVYVYDPASDSHSIVQDLSGSITGGDLESGGAAYLDGYLYIGPEDASHNGTYVYKIPVSSDGKSFTGSPVSIGNLAGSSKGWGDFVILKNGSSGIIYGQSADASTGNGEFWKYDLSTGTRTVIKTTSTGGTWQLALDLYGRLWRGISTNIQKIDFEGNTYGTTYSVSETVTDMTGPFNCVQGDFTLDTDGDGIANIIDLDSDGDGIPDNVEAQSTSGYTAPSGSDTDGDGLDDNYDPDNGGTYIGYIDTDNDGTYDYLDLNSDNQGGNDTQEAGLSLSGSDSDGDGLDNSTDATSDYSDPNGTINNPSSLPDSDSDVSSGGDVDYRDNFDGDANDHDGDGIPDDKDIDDDNDGITDAEEVGISCSTTEIYAGGTGGKIYKVDLSTGTVSLMTTSTISGIDYINALASNPDDGVVYYGDGTSVYVYNPSTGNHSLVKDFSSEISGGNLEYGGAAYYNGYLYIAPEDGSGYGTYVYKIPVSNNGMTLGTAQSIGSPSGSSKGYGDFVVSGENSTGVIYGSTGGSGTDFWKYDINSGTKTIISSPSGNPYQLAVDIYGRKWASTGTSLQKIDKDGNLYGTTITLTENGIDLTGPFNCPQGDMSQDTDGDGVPDIYDLDSDNDGVPDVVEAGGSDPDHDGRIGSGSITDTDGDGLDDSVDPDNGGTALSKPDTDNDGIKDYLDLDSDDDGIPDNIETQSTTGYVSPSSTDDDGDGWDDNYDPSEGGSYIDPQDTDGDGTDDYLSQDSDGDGVDDNSESGITLSGNDSDGDGLDDNVDQTSDYSDPNGSINNPSTDLPDSDGDVSGSGDVDYRDDTDDSGGLPVKLIELNAEMVRNVAVISWITTSEINNDYFIVQRSKDGNEWENIKKVKGAGNSNVILNYTVFDNNPLLGVSYYRLVQFDFDGTSEISKTVQLINNSKSNKLGIYPNPAKGYVNIVVAETAIVKIVAANGRLVINKQMNAGQNKLDIHDVKPGIYYVKMVTDDNVVVRKLIVK
jgi:hypothetical protein